MSSTTCVFRRSGLRLSGSPLVYQRETQTWQTTLRITNTCRDAVSGPLVLALDKLSRGVTLVNATGRYHGSPCIEAPLPGGTLLPGCWVEVSLELSRPGLWRWLGIHYVPRAYAVQERKPALATPALRAY